MPLPFTRLQIERSLDSLVEREDGVTFQRLARRLLRRRYPRLTPHAVKRDRGRDASQVGPDGTTVMCATLSATLSKVTSDVKRLLETGDAPLLVVICTAATVTNESASKWFERVQRDFGVELEILERTWVVDECLRPENMHVVVQELAIAPEFAEGAREGLLLGDVALLSNAPRTLGGLAAARIGAYTFFVWYVYPSAEDDECIELRRFTCGDMVMEQSIAGRADADCLLHEGQLLVSSIRLDGEGDEPTWTVFLDRLDHDLTLHASDAVAEHLRGLRGSPQLLGGATEPHLVYVTSDGSDSAWIHAHGVHSGNTEHQPLPFGPVYRFRAATHLGRIFCALEASASLEVLAFDGSLWSSWAAVPKGIFGGKGVGRFAWSLGSTCVFLVQVVGGPWSLYSVAVDPHARNAVQPWPITHHGMFPDISRVGDQYVASWVGSPPLPSELAGKEFVGTSMELHESCLRSIEQTTTRQSLEQALSLGRSHRDWLAEQSRRNAWPAPPWAPLWLVALDELGRCRSWQGPLGYGSRENWCPMVVALGSSGVLAWKCGEGQDNEAHLLIRPFALADQGGMLWPAA